MSRKQLALFEPTLVLQALKEAVKKIKPAGAMAQSGDVYRLDRQFADHLYLHRNGKRCDAWQCAV
ncbi:hypothetical protein HT118_24210 [Escherichia coli]|nr:hypothetical protein [Escherichia coli]